MKGIVAPRLSVERARAELDGGGSCKGGCEHRVLMAQRPTAAALGGRHASAAWRKSWGWCPGLDEPISPCPWRVRKRAPNAPTPLNPAPLHVHGHHFDRAVIQLAVARWSGWKNTDT